MEVHKDFSECAVERATKIEWSSRLFRLAQQSSVGRAAVSSAHAVFGMNEETPPCILRPLLQTEITALQTVCRCRSNDWSKLRLLLLLQHHNSTADGAVAEQSEQLKVLVSDTTFDGTVVLILASTSNHHASPTKTGRKHENDWVHPIPAGIHGCLLFANSMIHMDTARVHRCSVIEYTYVDAHATVLNCGRISSSNCCCSSSTTITVEPLLFQPSLHIAVGPESGGGRHLQLTPESTMIQVGQQLLAQNTVPLAKKENHACFNVIGSRSIVRDTATVDTVYLHPGSFVEAATVVHCAVLFPASAIRNASTVKNAVLQWNCVVTDHSSVTDTMLMEHAAAGPLSVVANTVLGPDVHVSAGEIHASVLGPNCNAHHQSLLIAVLWPTGRGNVGYGANVGSNHTGRIPDQECCAGEGTFWGLSCVVKFPVDLSAAPYTIVAAGTTLAPQRCTMPFSLIVNNDSGSGGGGTSIIPGWVLRNSPYTIVRSEVKFATRRKAARHASYTGWKILRPQTIDLCVAARRALQSVHGAALYESDTALPGIGASQLTEKGRIAGIQAYTECIQQFALQGLYTFLVASRSKSSGSLDKALASEFDHVAAVALRQEATSGDTSCGASVVRWPEFPWDADQSPEAFWKSQRTLLLEEFPVVQNVAGWARSLLQQFLVLETTYAERVYKCKERDDARGIATIPDYKRAHILVDQDPVIAAVRADLKVKEETVQALLLELDGSWRSKL
jgi:carbonic anhydrase/acetyltransferase-like protein (isoleucine patch superfamily)